MHRKLWWAVLAIGLVLAIAPFAISLPSRASAGQDMIDGFRPIMQPGQVATTARYYNEVFVPLGQMTPLLSAENMAKFQGYAKALASIQGPGSAQMKADFAQLFGAMQQGVPIFAQVPAGLAHYKPLVTTMQANVDNFQQVNSLPDFRLFTAFFVVPGVLLILLAGYGLFGEALRDRVAFDHHIRPTHA